MKIIHTKHFPFGRYSTINLFGVLFTKRDNLSKTTINHESIHTEQIKEMFYIFFYIWYGLEYIIIRLFHLTKDGQHKTYRDVSFEEEACNNEKNLDYLKTRKHYSWWKYIKPNSNEIH